MSSVPGRLAGEDGAPVVASVRTLGAADAAAFQELRLRGLLECPAAFASSHAEEVGTPITAVAARLEPGPDQAVFGAFIATRMVGTVGMQRERPSKLAHKALLWGMYVAPEARRAGAGRALVSAALAWAANAPGLRQVNLGVSVATPAAATLYESLGFRQFGFEREFMLLDGDGRDERHMVCFIRPQAHA
jgi:GNAT superfamily N-acetyltransferase